MKKAEKAKAIEAMKALSFEEFKGEVAETIDIMTELAIKTCNRHDSLVKEIAKVHRTYEKMFKATAKAINEVKKADGLLQCFTFFREMAIFKQTHNRCMNNKERIELSRLLGLSQGETEKMREAGQHAALNT